MDKKFIANEKYVKEIITDYDALSDRCDEFEVVKDNVEAQRIILSLKNTIRAHDDMVGLSANQIGFNKRIICLNFNGDIRTFINPVITNVHGFQLSREKCHSIPNKEFIRTRHNRINVTYQTPLGKIEEVELAGLAAIVFQHHIDHLDGLLLSDVSLEIDSDFDNASEEERQEVIDMYLDSLDIKKKNIDIEIEKDPEAKQIADGIRFIQSVQSGQTKLEQIPWTQEQIELVEKFKEQQLKK